MNTLGDPIIHALNTGPERLAVVCGDVRLSFQQMYDRMCRLVGGLATLGLRPGDRVAMLAANSHQYIEFYQAVPAAGMVIVPLNTRHAEPELRYALQDAGAKVLFTDRDPGALADLVDHVVLMPEGYEALLDGGTSCALASATPGNSPLDPAVSLDENTLAGLFYTGGTTGASKGVMLSHRNLVANTWHTSSLLPLTAVDRYLVMAPLFHAAGSCSVLLSVWTGAAQIILPAFDPAEALDLIEREQASVTIAVPTMIAAMNELQLVKPRDVSSMRMLSHGGSPIATEVVRRAVSAFPDAELVHLYGATETSPLATGLRDEQTLIDDPRIRSCGKPIMGVQIRILADDGAICPAAAVGEVCIRGANVMMGYWNKPEQTAEALVDGWYRTGDLGWMDDAGHLFLVDRKKDMIVTGGENVYSTEVEDVLFRHPAVLEAAVFGVPDPRWGEAVSAVVVPRDEVDLGPDDGGDTLKASLTAFCRESLAGYKVPKHIEIQREALPKSGPGKVLKRSLRAAYWSDGDRQIS